MRQGSKVIIQPVYRLCFTLLENKKTADPADSWRNNDANECLTGLDPRERAALPAAAVAGRYRGGCPYQFICQPRVML